MTMSVNIGGVWKTVPPQIKIAGVWKAVTNGWVNIAGTWRQFYAAVTVLDTQTVTVSQTGSAGSRQRGFKAALGSISDGTSNIFGGAAITQMFFDETSADFALLISGASNSGWTTMTNVTDGTSLNRSAASFSAGRWTWASQALGGFFNTTSGSKTIEFT